MLVEEISAHHFPVAGIFMNSLSDDTIGDFIKVRLQDFAQLEELRPQGLFHEAGGHPHHDRAVALALVAIGPQFVAVFSFPVV